MGERECGRQVDGGGGHDEQVRKATVEFKEAGQGTLA